MNHGSIFHKPFSCLILIVLAFVAVAAMPSDARANLAINATFDSSITGDSHATQIENGINQALQFYSQNLTNPISVNIYFKATSASYLGQTQSAASSQTYAAYTGLLQANATAHPSNTTEQTALNHLSDGNDSNGSKSIIASNADLRALGLTAYAGTLNSNGGFGGTYDAVITLASNHLSAFGSGSYDLNRVVQHEVDEVLGIGGRGSHLNAGNPNSAYGPLDLFRFSGSGTASYTTSGSASSYFSIDGGQTNLVSFNQDSSGDYGDWGGSTNYVQQAFSGTSSRTLQLSDPEITALQVVGYNLAVPEPASLAMLAVAGLLVLPRRRRAAN